MGMGLSQVHRMSFRQLSFWMSVQGHQRGRLVELRPRLTEQRRSERFGFIIHIADNELVVQPSTRLVHLRGVRLPRPRSNGASGSIWRRLHRPTRSPRTERICGSNGCNRTDWTDGSDRKDGEHRNDGSHRTDGCRWIPNSDVASRRRGTFRNGRSERRNGVYRQHGQHGSNGTDGILRPNGRDRQYWQHWQHGSNRTDWTYGTSWSNRTDRKHGGDRTHWSHGGYAHWPYGSDANLHGPDRWHRNYWANWSSRGPGRDWPDRQDGVSRTPRTHWTHGGYVHRANGVNGSDRSDRSRWTDADREGGGRSLRSDRSDRTHGTTRTPSLDRSNGSIGSARSDRSNGSNGSHGGGPHWNDRANWGLPDARANRAQCPDGGDARYAYDHRYGGRGDLSH
jgi:hypothetical protein